jgi:predicted nucleic acid-binding protein
MRTTIDIDDRLLAAARRRAAENGMTLTAFVEHALAACLARRPAAAKPYRLAWKTTRGRTLPGDHYLRLLRDLVDESGVRGNLVFDAQIAAVCLEHGATMLLTEDRDYARVRKLTPITLQEFHAR